MPIGWLSLRKGWGTLMPIFASFGKGLPLALEAVPQEGAKCAHKIMWECLTMKSDNAATWSGSFKS